MITVSLIREIQFIAFFLKKKVAVSVTIGEYKPVDFTVFDDVLEVKYSGQIIWRESLSGAAANFGVESCDTILNIMQCIEDGKDWSAYPSNHVIASEATI